MRYALLLLVVTGCADVSPVLRRGLDRLEKVEAHRNEREAVLRELLGNAWRALILVESGMRFEREGEDGLTVDEAKAVLADALKRVDRARGLLVGYELESAASTQAASRLRAALSGALRELEERSAATDALVDTLEAGAEQAGRFQADREKRKAAEAEARRLEALKEEDPE